MENHGLVPAVIFTGRIGVASIEGQETLCAEMVRFSGRRDQIMGADGDALNNLWLDHRTHGLYLPAAPQALSGMIGANSYSSGSLMHLRNAQKALDSALAETKNKTKTLNDFPRLKAGSYARYPQAPKP